MYLLPDRLLRSLPDHLLRSSLPDHLLRSSLPGVSFLVHRMRTPVVFLCGHDIRRPMTRLDLATDACAVTIVSAVHLHAGLLGAFSGVWAGSA